MIVVKVTQEIGHELDATLTNKKVRKALKGSIKKWEKIADGTGLDRGSENCPLCETFQHERRICAGCPIQVDTGRGGCSGTPYDAFAEYSDPCGRAVTALAANAAQAMVNYLKKLDRKYFKTGVVADITEPQDY